jgi:cyclopropane fatty-acyl-phospholipid synthase-like methyltransferase
MTSVVPQAYWDSLYSTQEARYDSETRILFEDLFDRFLKPGGTCFEVGCYPGNFLIHLGRKFGYEISGIDATPFVQTRMVERLRRHNLRTGHFFLGDFLEFHSPQLYDVVCSFGFIEHFTNFEEVIEKHIRMLAPGGTLILSCPNFRYAQFVFHRLLDPVNLTRHVLKAMDLNRWRELLERNDLKILHHDYYKTAGFWADTPRPGKLMSHAIYYVKRINQIIDLRMNYPNRFLSPYMISISRSPG